ncbi:hypothetical protein [Anabaena sp. CCY 9910]|uniref:hypothetical protein n=1 Tax=Anabaena sp. CCY 9910 TaxID=3103870 RepID=UPI0039E1A5B0
MILPINYCLHNIFHLMLVKCDRLWFLRCAIALVILGKCDRFCDVGESAIALIGFLECAIAFDGMAIALVMLEKCDV